jgi:hypothetical protein
MSLPSPSITKSIGSQHLFPPTSAGFFISTYIQNIPAKRKRCAVPIGEGSDGRGIISLGVGLGVVLTAGGKGHA